MKSRILLLLLVLCSFLSKAQQLIINEFSQGANGAQEYIELVVAGQRNCSGDSCADIRGWIIDDNNGWYGAAGGQGIAPGHIRFSNSPNWSCVPYGSIILLYNLGDKNPVITMPDDPTDANGDHVYVLPSVSPFIEGSVATPLSPSSTTYSYPTGTAYTASPAWNAIGLANTGDAVIVADEAERAHPGAFQPASQQHAQRLVGEAALERIGDEIEAPAAREGLDKKLAGLRQARDPLLRMQPGRDLLRQRVPEAGRSQDRAHAGREEGREREFAAVIGGDLRIGAGGGARADRLVLDDALEAQHLAGEDEGVARHHGLGEILLDLSEHAPAAADHARLAGLSGARPSEPDLQHRRLDDGADIHAVLLDDAGMAGAPEPGLVLPELGEALIALQRIAAGRDEIDDGVEIRAVEIGVRRGGADLFIERIGFEPVRAGDAEHMLGEHVERADTRRRRVLRRLMDGLERRAALQQFETVRGHQ